jgi:hypothetical protein
MLGENRPFADEENGVHYFDNLAVLRTASVPALLFEAGVILHRDEELRMRDPAVRARIASGIVEAVASCIENSPEKSAMQSMNAKDAKDSFLYPLEGYAKVTKRREMGTTEAP